MEGEGFKVNFVIYPNLCPVAFLSRVKYDHFLLKTPPKHPIFTSPSQIINALHPSSIPDSHGKETLPVQLLRRDACWRGDWSAKNKWSFHTYKYHREKNLWITVINLHILQEEEGYAHSSDWSTNMWDSMGHMEPGLAARAKVCIPSPSSNFSSPGHLTLPYGVFTLPPEMPHFFLKKLPAFVAE